MADDTRALKDRVARRYGLVAPVFDRIGPPLFSLHGRRLVELAQVAPGERVLDVAAGRGAVLFPAAERVGLRGRVIAIDMTPEMVQRTAQDIRRRGVTNAEIRQMDAEDLDFPDASFDSVLCGFGLFFFPGLKRALAEFQRVLRPWGRFAATTDGKPDERWTWWADLRAAYQVEARVAAQNLEDPGELVGALQEVGFADIRGVEGEFDLVYTDEEEWWASQHVDLEARIDPEVLGRLKAVVFEQIQAVKQQDGIHRLSRARYSLAVKPG